MNITCIVVGGEYVWLSFGDVPLLFLLEERRGGRGWRGEGGEERGERREGEGRGERGDRERESTLTGLSHCI